MEVTIPKVIAHKHESSQQLLRRFRKTVTRSGVLGEVRKRRWHVSKSEERRLEKKKAIRRFRRKERRVQQGTYRRQR